MPGWRVGFAVGNERLIHALTRVKSYLDYGAFTPIQVAAAAALNGPQDCINEIRGIYKRRRDCLVDAITRAGWPIPSPPATMFAWAPIPEMFSHLGSLEFCKLLLEKASVAVSPGAGFGEYGEGYVASRSSRTSSASARLRATSASSDGISKVSAQRDSYCLEGE
jgi:alanine-synthesizing transaminase